MGMKRIIAIFIVLLVTAGPVFSQKKELYRVRTVVIDPGHGGAKPGAQGKKSWEKDLTLSVAKKFGKIIEDNYPDVKVIYTRTTDVDISLAERAHIANRNKADLFISIHANSHPTIAPTGVETFVMGLSESRANLEVAKKENADILLEADYKSNSDYNGFDPNAPETYVMLTMFQNAFIDKSLNLAQAIQSQYKQHIKTINRGVKQAELYVLYKTTCPSVLTEIGFISNPTEEAFMLSDEGQAKIAVCLFNAFMTYKTTEEGTDRIANPVINIKGWKQEGGKEEKKAETKATAKEAPQEVAEAKPETPKMEEKPAAPKAEEKPVAPKVEEKPAAPKVEEKPTAPKVEEKPTAPKVEQKPVVPTPQPAVEEKKPATQPELPPVVESPKENPSTKPTPSAQLPTVKKPEPSKGEAKPQQPKDEAKPATTNDKMYQPRAASTDKAEVRFRVQICSSLRQLKPGDPDLHGIKDINTAKNGKYYMYTAGNYTTEQEARRRCKTIQTTTPFHDAFVVAIYKGERITLERARQIVNQNKQK